MLRSCILFGLSLLPGVLLAEEEVDFARQILPILSNKCFLCHGPDAEEGELRLDSAAAAYADLGGHRAIDPENPSESIALHRIHSSDDPMPPEHAEKPLTQPERDLLSQWIKQGGEYAMHWGFVKPHKDREHKGNSAAQIDAFIQQQLQAKQIDFAPAAEKSTLARRAAFVLTGLPPEPKMLEAFLADESEDAYERLVDRLLASPRFGEHQARYWLDAVRYGDTHGLHLDNKRGIYAYRDWVVKAFNDNLPLNDFITWQLAGDLLPDPSLEQLAATGFIRLNPSTGEGGAIGEEFQAKNNFDRVETFGTVMMGMTLNCVRCHTHKYDPIQHAEYYQLMAFFNSTAEPALDGNSYTYGPVAWVPANQTAWKSWTDVVAQRDETIQAATSVLQQSDREAALVKYATPTTNWKSSDWKMSKPVPADAEFPWDSVSNEKTSEPELSHVAGLPGEISGRSSRGKVPTTGEAIWVTATVEVPQDQSLRVSFSGALGSELWVDDKPLVTTDQDANDRLVTARPFFSSGQHHLRLKIVGGKNVNEIIVKVQNPWDTLATNESWETCNPSDQLEMLADRHGPWNDLDLHANATNVVAASDRLQAKFVSTLIAQDLPQPRETRLLQRGEYDMPIGDPLQPSGLKVLNPFPDDAPPNRLGLARWLTSSDNPLVARVLANRIWQRTFGEGLVRTPEDFGLQGQQPTHPELLDWLAVEMHQSNWNLKHLLKQMVTSRTFCQSSKWRNDIDDPENRLWSRGPSFRLDAEVLRDVGLWASGLLDPQMGGEGVKPYQPAGMWLAMAHPASNTKQYVRDEGDLLYRRSLYVYWKRTSPHPMMTLFDAPDRETSCVRRSRTTTALQSLGMLNETQRIEIGRKYAEQLLDQYPSDSARLEGLWKALTCRPPTPTEQQVCLDLLQQLRQRYETDPESVEELLSIGEAKTKEGIDPIETAAWTQVVTTVLASDVAILLY